MASNFENVLSEVRTRLRIDDIKLWLPPYYLEEMGPDTQQIEELAKVYHRSLKLQLEDCERAIKELQQNAIDKLKSKKEYNETGLATLKIRAVLHSGQKFNFTIQQHLNITGKIIQKEIAEKLEVNTNRLKLIQSGKIVNIENTLESQGIGNNHQIMALVLHLPTENEKNVSDIYDRARSAKEDAKAILKSNHTNFLRMEDQDGNAVHLPPAEKNSILMALALHEKGRGAMKREQFNEALVLLLEADEEFASCSAQILNIVDNYALLNLDIVWCYLCLQNLTQLPDAERRLEICEQNFRRSYGDNFDRVTALKGSSENERALILRLHLLKAIVYYHQNEKQKAKTMLNKAESELKRLKIDDVSLASLMQMGYTLGESRIALRSTGGNVENAVRFILDRREKKEAARKRAKAENLIADQLNNEENKEKTWVDPRKVKTLIEMGFEKHHVFKALKESKNEIDSAIQYLHSHRGSPVSEPLMEPDINKKLVDEIVAMGFDEDMAKFVLESSENNYEQAMEIISKLISDNESRASNSSNEVQPGPSIRRESFDYSTKDKLKVSLNKIKTEIEAKKAYERFVADVSMEEDEYLDLPLLQEEQILLEYKSFLN